MPLPPESFAVAALIVAGAFVVFGLTGFGSTIIAVPLLAHFLPLKFVIPMFVLLDFGAALRSGLKFHATMDKRELKAIVPCMLAGVAAGVFLLVNLPADWLALALGVFVVGYGALAASGREPDLRLAQWWAIPVSLVGGVMSALFGASGPLFVIYLTARGLDLAVVRATMAVVFLITTSSRIAMFAVAGLFSQENVLTSAALFALPMLAGVWLGHHIELAMPRRRLMQLIGALLVLSGASLAINVLAKP